MIDTSDIEQLVDNTSCKTSKKKRKRPKKLKKYWQINTTNYSFIKMYRILKDLGIENNKFFLVVYDEDLLNVDPFSDNLTQEIKLKILLECKRNFYYFIRECVRIPVSGSGIGPGKGKKYELHRGNLALNFCVLANFKVNQELPRQNGKSIGVDVLLLWLLNFGTNTTKMLMMNKDGDNAKENIARIKDMRDCLPLYLQGTVVFNENKVKIKSTDNKEYIENDKTNNRIDIKKSPTNPGAADNAGRGCTQAVQWFDEFGFLKFNDIIFKAAAPATGQAFKEAKANHKPHSVIITSTPGDIVTDYGKVAKKYLDDSAEFQEIFYDWTEDEIREYIYKNSVNGFIRIRFNYRQLGRDEKWFEDQVIDLGGDWHKIRREVLLQWGRAVANSPYPQEDLDALVEMSLSKTPIRPAYINKYYVLNIYEDVSPRTPILLGIDVSSGIGKDSSTIVAMDSKTKKIVAIFENCRISLREFSKVIKVIAEEIYPNCLICIERNNVGISIIQDLLDYGLEDKIYKDNNKDETSMKVRDGYVESMSVSSCKYGVWTDGTKREQMHDKLNDYVLYFKERICASQFVDQLKSLILDKRGRVDHQDGQHDDVVMGYLMALWVYYFGKNIQAYNILRYPDPDPGETTDEMLNRMYMEKVKAKEEPSLLQQSTFNSRVNVKTSIDFINEVEADVQRRLDIQAYNDEDAVGSEMLDDYETIDLSSILSTVKTEDEDFQDYAGRGFFS